MYPLSCANHDHEVIDLEVHRLDKKQKVEYLINLTWFNYEIRKLLIFVSDNTL